MPNYMRVSSRKPHNLSRRRSIALLGLWVAVSFPVLAGAAEITTRQVGTARLEGVPEISVEVKSAVQRFQNYREARFRDWLPDGSMLITTRFGATQQVHRVVAPGAARTQLTFFDDPVDGVVAIPRSSRFLFSRDSGGDEWFQLYALGLKATGGATAAGGLTATGGLTGAVGSNAMGSNAMGLTGAPLALTEPGTRNASPVFSDDGTLVAWSRAIKGSGDYAILTANPEDPSTRRLAYAGQGAVHPVDLSADQRSLLVARVLSSRETRLLVVDLANGKARELDFTATPARYDGARFTPDGRGIVVITDADGDFRQLVEIDLASGKRRLLSAAVDWDVTAFDLTDDGRLVAYVINEDGFSRVAVIDRVTGRALPPPELPRGVLAGLGFSPDGQHLALSVSTATTAGDVWSVEVATGALTRWTESELGGLDSARLAEPRLIRFPSFDGLSVPAFVYRPTHVADGVATPVVIDIHGGPEAQTRPTWNPGAQLMAELLGATVILPNVRGSDGYGKTYCNLDNGPLREDSVKDIGALLDWIAAQPDLDREKVAVYGGSYGGYMALAVMIHYGDRLVGGVERYGISDFITFLNNTEAYRRDNRRAEYGDERDPAMRAVFERINPLANVRRINKPMLVLQGANDPRVPQSESDQVVAGIRANGVNVWYVVFADEGHGFSKKHNNDLRREVETVFLQSLFAGREVPETGDGGKGSGNTAARPVAGGAAAAASVGVAPLPAGVAPERSVVLRAAREVMAKARYASMVTNGEDDEPQARIVDPFAPEEDLTVWVATKAASRKVEQLRRDPRVTLLYFDPLAPSTVTLYGDAVLVTDPAVKAAHWKPEWTAFYRDTHRGDDYLLIRVTPTRLEILSDPHGLGNDPDTWRPIELLLAPVSPMQRVGG